MANATQTNPGEVQLAGALGGNNDATAPELTATGATAGAYDICNVTVAPDGRITAISEATPGELVIATGDATTSNKGVVMISDGISVTAGVITADMTYISANVTPAENATLGIVKSADTTHITFSSGDVDVGSNVGLKEVAGTWSAAQVVALYDIGNVTGSISTNSSLSNVFTVTMTGDCTLANPTNLVAGGTYVWIISQDATGGRELDFGTVFKFPAGAVITADVVASSKTVISSIYDGTDMLSTSRTSW